MNRNRLNYKFFQKGLLTWGGSILFFLLLFFVIEAKVATVSLPEENSPLLLYSTETRDDLQALFLRSIEEAKSSISLITYSFTDAKIIQALKNKSLTGVKVRVICDHQASQGVGKKLGRRVVTIYKQGKGLMHQKILITDGCRVFIGSANITTASLKMHGNLVFGLYSPGLAQYLGKKVEGHSKEGAVTLLPPEQLTVGGQKIEMHFLPDDSQAISRLKQLIRSAKKSIQVAMFTWTRYDLAQELQEAKKRGVKVTVALDNNSSRGASQRVAELLHQGGIPLLVNRGSGLLHHKFVLIDEKCIAAGSANWTLAAFTQNDDCFLIINELSEPQKKKMQRLWRAIELDSEVYRDRGQAA